MKIKKNQNLKFYDRSLLNISNNEIFYLDFKESILSSRIKRAPNHKTLVEATKKWDYAYWLSQEDIADIARLEYRQFPAMDESNADFEILGSLSQLFITLQLFQSKIITEKLTKSRLTLIVNLEGLHWVTLVIFYQENNYLSYYIDSKNNPLPPEYFSLMTNQLGIQQTSISPGFIQQQDGYNCGLWALENAADLNRMLDNNYPLYWLIKLLQRPRDEEYFRRKRILFSQKLNTDPAWRERHLLLLKNLEAQEESLLPLDMPFTRLEKTDSDPKRFKASAQTEKEKTILLAVFVETFISAFIKKLGAYHLLAKGERLTEEALRTELKTGTTTALLGISIAQSLVGAIPSLVASLRMINSKYYLSKDKAQKITKIFSEFKSDRLKFILAEAAVSIFHSYENQFMQVTDKAGEKIAMEKLAEDAVDRTLNYIGKDSNRDRPISKELIEEGVSQGPSEKFFDPDVKRARLRISGYSIQDKSEKKINTANLYEKVGLVVFNKNNEPGKFYTKEDPKYQPRYGYRRLFEWEKESDGELKKKWKEEYIDAQPFYKESILQFISNDHSYVLHSEKISVEAQRILDKIENRYPPQWSERHENKKPIYFNLRKPVKNFSGRIQILEQLHRILMSERTIAIIPSWSRISIASSNPSTSDSLLPSSGSQLSISGLGGIGKTQLALRYAELYANDYDHNVLWINAETLENIGYSFDKLAEKTQINTKDRYEQKKSLVDIVEAIYDYFSDRKSLFIFDNVENSYVIQDYLPKSRPGNNPTVLITSRFNHWDNIANSVLPLNVFTEQETEELIKKSLTLQSNQDKKIRELNQLLQGLPLALQQALAYIKLRRNSNTNFSLDHYIERYKEKSKELLDFNFSHYLNDPYLKTVFTTWLITLDNIKKEPLGNEAIEILNILAYLYPDNIASEKIFYFNHINRNLSINDLDSIMQLLVNYSMINSENQSRYTIHRLVQQIIRLKLEENQAQFKETVGKIQKLIWYWEPVFKKDKEIIFHNLHFLLYMSEHKELISSLGYAYPEKAFFDILLMKNAKYFGYFIDLAHKNFTKKNFYDFLGNAIAYYIKLGAYFNLTEILNYLEQQWREEVLSPENIKYIVERFYNVENPLLKFKGYSTIPEKKENQRRAIRLVVKFKTKLFSAEPEVYNSCSSHSLKRSICLSSETEREIQLRNRNIKAHVEKIRQISGYLSSTLITKDILSAMLQGHFDEVAFDFGLITSSFFFEKISNSLLIQGKNLASETTVLEKNSGLKSKILDILFNEDIVSASKRQFLGKIMRVASPFVAKTTSIFFAYNLNNEIKTYKMGDKTVLPDMILNSIIVGIDGIEAGIEAAEFFGIISGLSAFTGPLGEGVAMLAWLGAEGYTAEQKVETLKKYLNLSTEEQVIQFLRSFFDLAPSEYLQVKIKNAQSIMHAIDFFKKNTAVKWYVFPSFYNETVLHKNNIFLEIQDLIADDSKPDASNKAHIFCLETLDSLNLSYKNITIKTKPEYFCQNTLGVMYTFNRTGNATLIHLGEGEDKAIAFTNSPTLFFVQNGKKLYIGGNAGNIFNLQGNAISGLIRGGDGTDILILDNFYPQKNDTVLFDIDDYLCGKNASTIHSTLLSCSAHEFKIKTYSVNQIYGRKNQQDIIYLNEEIYFIDGQGGKNKELPDRLLITEHSYNTNLKFVLRNNTHILFSINTTINSIDYRIPADEIGETQIIYPFNEPIQHRFFFECSLANIDAITLTNNTLHIAVLIDENTARKKFAITISDAFFTSESNQTKNTSDLPKNISYFFEKNEIKLINNTQLYIQEISANNKTLDEKISLFSELANRLEKTLSIQLINNITISIGQGKHEIFYINSSLESHIMGNGGENVYIILTNNKTEFPLSKITLYDNSTTDLNELVEFTDTLDLREIVKKYKQIYPNAIISSHVFPAANDLILTLSNAVYSPTQYDSYDVACFLPWATIQLKDALLNNTNWYQKLDIFLNSIPKNIVPLDEEFWSLSTAPLIFTEDKKIIFITHQAIEEGMKFQILRNIGDYAFFRNETDLILTNVIFSIDYCTIIFQKFYQESEMRKKILSATLEFFNQKICLQDYEDKIDHPFHFDQMISANPLDPKTQIFLNSSMIQPSDNQNRLLQPIMRHKRQVEFEEKSVVNNIPKSTSAKRLPKRVNQTVLPQMTQNSYPTSTFNKKERILAIADDYLEKYDNANSKRKSYNKKNYNQQQNKKQTASSFASVQEKKSKSTTKIHPSHHAKKNKHSYQKTFSNSNNTVQNKPKPFVKSHTENLSQTHFFYKSEAAKRNESFFTTNKQLYYVESFRPTIKASSNHPLLIDTKYKSESRKSNQYTPHTLSSHRESPNAHSTLMLLDFFIRKTLKNPIKPISFDKKAFKNSKKVERQTDRIKSKTYGIPLQKLH